MRMTLRYLSDEGSNPTRAVSPPQIMLPKETESLTSSLLTSPRGRIAALDKAYSSPHSGATPQVLHFFLQCVRG